MDIANIVGVSNINIGKNGLWIGSFGQFMTGTLLIEGGTFLNQNSGSGHVALVKIDANVIGSGTFNSGAFGKMELVKSVSAGQTVNIGIYGGLTIDDPTDFHGTVNLTGAYEALTQRSVSLTTHDDTEMQDGQTKTCIAVVQVTGS